MRSAVREQSVAAYYAFVGDGKRNRQHQLVIAALAGKPLGLTRAELATATGLPINVICPRVDELRDAGTIEEMAKRPNPSGAPATPLRLVPLQASLFPEAA